MGFEPISLMVEDAQNLARHKKVYMARKNALMKNSFPIFVLASKIADFPKIFSTNGLFKLYNITYTRPKHSDS